MQQKTSSPTKVVDQRRILILCSLLPPPVSLDILTEVGGLSPVNALAMAEELVKKGTLITSPQNGVGFYQFNRSGSAARVLEEEEPSLIKEMASSLIRLMAKGAYPEPKASLVIANAYFHSNLPVKELEPVLRAADYCLKNGAREAAAIYYRMTLEAKIEKKPSDREKSDWINSALGVLAASGHLIPLEQQENILKQAREKARQINNLTSLCKIYLRLGQIRKLHGNYQKAGQLFEEAWRLALALENPTIKKEAAFFTTDFLFWQGRVAAAVARYEEVIGNLEEFPSEEPVLRACATLGWCYGICGQTARGLGLMEAVRQKACSLGFRQAEMDANVMSLLAMIDAGYFEEARAMVDEVFKHPEEELGNYRLWASYAAKGYLLFKKGDLASCFYYQKKAYNKSKEIGWPHHRGPFNFEYMEALEEAGMLHPEMNYDSELKRVSGWPDIYMQGVGFRFKARRMQKKGLAKSQVMQCLLRSRDLLQKAGAGLELARTQVELAKLHLAQEEEKTAKRLLQKAWKVLAAVNEDLFPYELRPYLEAEPAEDRIIRVMTELGLAVGTVLDRNNLLERVINLLMKLTLAGRGGFFITDDKGKIRLVASRNLEQSLVESPVFSPVLGLVQKAFSSRNEPLDNLDPKNDALLGLTPGRGWSLCRRVSLQGQLLGVIYLDNTLVGMTPPARVLTFLDLVLNHVALALDNARAYEEIHGLKEKLEDETRLYRTELQFADHVGKMVGNSLALGRVLKQVQKVAPTETTVLINGETGVGKELVARAVHKLSKHADGPFIPVDTASLDPGVVASELFGHEKGAFTGAAKTRRGRFELEDRGTLFLDDVDNLPLDVQAKLLRALQEREFQRLGGNRLIRSEFRLIAATNQDLEKLVQEGKFRSDLYFRLKVFPIVVPPLKERTDDIPILANFFLEKLSSKMGKKLKGISKSDMQRLIKYPWPGNVRELKHVIERAVILSEGEMLLLPDLKGKPETKAVTGEFLTLAAMERKHILTALASSDGKVAGKGGAAELLGLKPTTLYSKLKKLNINKKYL
jgi:transcriptional regulator with GAF, ATPase, and Fis domain/tetratricopeptide (TPR) repeat protein